MIAKRDPTLPPLSEKAFAKMVIAWAKLCRWRVYFTWNSMHSPAGFVDLVLVRPPQLLFRELKTDKGKLTTEQENWLHDLIQCGKDASVWRPAQWQEIEDQLR